MARHVVDPTSMHRYTDETERVARAALGYARDRLRLHPVPLDGPRTAEELTEAAGATITEDGLGGEARCGFSPTCWPRPCISIDNPRFLAFIPAAPTELSMMFDLVVGASSIYAGTWMEASGAVYAENQALRLARRARGPSGDDSGLLRLGRHDRQPVGAGRRPPRPPRGARRRRGAPLRVACTDETHSSVATAAAVMDVGLLRVAPDTRGRHDRRRRSRRRSRPRATDGLFAVAPRPGRRTSAPSTTWPASPRSAEEHGVWMHVDGAYGGAALAAPSVRDRFAGIEHADSFIVDPHKWLFAPFDSCALLYRNPGLARAAHTQQAGYLEHVAGQRAQPVGLRGPPQPAGAGPAVLVLARRARDARLHRGDRAHAGRRPPGRRRDPGPARRRAPERAGADGARPAAAGLGARRLHGVDGAAAGRRRGVRDADGPRRRDGHAVRDREPANDARQTSPPSSTRWRLGLAGGPDGAHRAVRHDRPA